MTAPPARTGTNLGIGLVIAIPVLSGLLRGSGELAAWVTGHPRPEAPWSAGLLVLLHPARPGIALEARGLSPLAYWAVVALALAVLGAAAWRLRGLVSTMPLTAHSRPVDPHRRPGTASRSDVLRAASARAVRTRGATLRPSLTRPPSAELGYLLGTSHHRQVWATVEDSMLLIGPPRSGKGLHVVINSIIDAPGAVISTSTRPDNLTATLHPRRQRGPVAVFDPQQLAPGLDAGMRWSPVRGCEDPLTAMIRAAGFASSTGLGAGGTENGSFWEGKTRTALQALLHAAALDGRGASDLYQWSLNPSAAGDAVRVLQTHHHAATGWADSLDGILNADPRTRDSIWHGVSLAFAALADPRVLHTVSPRAGETFDPESFLTANGALYLLFTASGAGSAGALVAALLEDIAETARRIAARSPGARLDPPLLLSLDEIGNLSLLPSLPTLMAEGGGTGITTMPVLQSLAQARQSWGENAAHAIWDSAIVKIILGGASDSRYLQELSTLIGEVDEHTDSTSTDHYGATSLQRSVRRVPILSPEAIRTLPFGTGVVLLRSTRPVITRLRPWPRRHDGDELREHKQQLERDLERHHTSGNGTHPTDR